MPDVIIPGLQQDVAELQVDLAITNQKVAKLENELEKSQRHISNLRQRVKDLEK